MVFIPRWDRYGHIRPSGPVSLDYNHPLAEGLVCAVIPQVGAVNLVTGQTATDQAFELVVDGNGVGAQIANSLSTTFTLSKSIAASAPISVFTEIRNPSVSNTTRKRPFRINDSIFLIDVFRNNEFDITFRTSSNHYPAKRHPWSLGAVARHYVAHTPGNFDDFFLNTDGVTISPISLAWGSSGNLNRFTSATTVSIGSSADGAFPLTSQVYFLYLYDRVHSLDEIKALNEYPYQILKPRDTYFDMGGVAPGGVAPGPTGGEKSYVTPSGWLQHDVDETFSAVTPFGWVQNVGAAEPPDNNLVLTDLNQTETVTSSDVTTLSSLVTTDLAQTESLSTSELQALSNLAVNDVTQTETLESVSLQTLAVLVPANVTQEEIISEVTFTSASDLELNNITQEETLTSQVLTGKSTLTLTNVTQTEELTTLLLSASGSLITNNVTQSEVLDTISLITDDSLLVTSLVQSEQLSTVALGSKYLLITDNVNQTEFVGTITFVAGTELEISSLQQSETVLATNLIGTHFLSTENITSTEQLSTLVTSINNLLFNNNLLQTEVLDNPNLFVYSTLQTENLISVEELSHVQFTVIVFDKNVRPIYIQGYTPTVYITNNLVNTTTAA